MIFLCVEWRSSGSPGIQNVAKSPNVPGLLFLHSIPYSGSMILSCSPVIWDGPLTRHLHQILAKNRGSWQLDIHELHRCGSAPFEMVVDPHLLAILFLIYQSHFGWSTGFLDGDHIFLRFFTTFFVQQTTLFGSWTTHFSRWRKTFPNALATSSAPRRKTADPGAAHAAECRRGAEVGVHQEIWYLGSFLCPDLGELQCKPADEMVPHCDFRASWNYNVQKGLRSMDDLYIERIHNAHTHVQYNDIRL